jgi:hypothetical protein
MGTIKNGHYIRECRSLKNWKKEEEGNNEANLVEDIVARFKDYEDSTVEQ